MEEGGRKRLREEEEEEEPNRAEETEEQNTAEHDDSILEAFWKKDDIWIKCIFPFLGAGYFAFLGLVTKDLLDLYKRYARACNVHYLS